MKYDAEIHPEEANTSHALVLDLVGRDRTVLDVGCSTGYLAKALAAQGCTVSGIEIDPEAAEQARPHLAQVVVADLDVTPLDALGIEVRFDVIVFADVLEHLKDPAGTLRAASGLLAPGGQVVVSIPNVAHGSVRLALLQGRFEYTEVGLLDDTHIRFFTRSSLYALVRAAGFVVADMRRTTAPVYGTEIRLDPGATPPETLAGLESDEDAETYQFVFSAVPGDADTDRLGELLAERDRELVTLRTQLAELVRLAQLGPRMPVVAVVAAGRSPQDRLRGEVVGAELRRRLGGFDVRVVDVAEVERLAGAGAGGTVAPWMDGAVFVGSLDPARSGLAKRLKRAGVTTALFAARVGESVDLDGLHGSVSSSPTTWGDGICPAVADPTLAGRGLYDPELLGHRVDFLRLVGSLPAREPYLLASFADITAGAGGPLIRSLSHVAAGEDLGVALLGAPEGASAHVVPFDTTVDLAASVAGASVVVTDDAAVTALALALGRPVVAVGSGDGELGDLVNWMADPDLLVPRLAAVPGALTIARARAADGAVATQLRDLTAQPLDALAGSLVESAAARAPRSLAERILELQDTINVVRGANAGLMVRQRAERVAFGARAAALLEGDASGPAVRWSTSQLVAERDMATARVEELGLELHQAHDEAATARAEVNALLSTRTLRTLAPARAIYRRLRLRLR